MLERLTCLVIALLGSVQCGVGECDPVWEQLGDVFGQRQSDGHIHVDHSNLCRWDGYFQVYLFYIVSDCAIVFWIACSMQHAVSTKALRVFI